MRYLPPYVLLAVLIPGAASSAPTPVTMDDLVEPGNVTWTTRGHVQGYALLDGIGPFAEGQVVCRLTRYDDDTGMVEDKPYTQMRGAIRDGVPFRGRRGVRWGVPLRVRAMSTRPIGRDLATCDVFDAGGRSLAQFETDFYVRPPRSPDLALASVDIRACGSRLPAHAKNRVCARLEHAPPAHLESDENAGVRVGVSCTVLGRNGTITTELAPRIGELGDPIYLPFGHLPAGEYDVECVTDAAGHVPESDETNNHFRAAVDVLEEVDPSSFVIQIGEVRRAATHAAQGDEAGPTRYTQMALEILNQGPHPIERADVTCTAGKVELTGRVALAGKGDALVVLTATSPLASGRHKMTCEARVVVPRLTTPPVARSTVDVKVTDR